MSKSSFFSSQPIKLLIAVGGIYTSYIYYGLIMEKLFNHDYSGLGRKKGTFDSFKFGFATSLFQNLFSFILAAIINRVFYNQSQSVMSTKTQIKMSIVNFVSIYLASTSLAYVSFPIQAIMKSSKILSILIVSLFFRSKTSHTKTQYLCGVLITAGIILFNFLQDTKGKHGGGETSLIGLGMIIASLFCDGLLGVVQDEAKKESRPSAWDLMESINKWGFLFCLFVALASGQIMQFVEYVKTYPACLTDLILLSVLGTVGQIFIFYTISNFSPLLLSIITTTRKFFTVLFSIIIYDHAMNFYQWIAIALVFIGVFIEMIGGKKHGSKEDQKTKETPEPAKISGIKSQASVKTSQSQSQSKVTKRG